MPHTTYTQDNFHNQFTQGTFICNVEMSTLATEGGRQAEGKRNVHRRASNVILKKKKGTHCRHFQKHATCQKPKYISLVEVQRVDGGK